MAKSAQGSQTAWEGDDQGEPWKDTKETQRKDSGRPQCQGSAHHTLSHMTKVKLTVSRNHYTVAPAATPSP